MERISAADSFVSVQIKYSGFFLVPPGDDEFDLSNVFKLHNTFYDFVFFSFASYGDFNQFMIFCFEFLIIFPHQESRGVRK
jgi:hypothetical protein